MPLFLLLTTYIVLEVYVLAKIWGAFGFVNVFFALLAGAVLGMGLVRSQGRFILQRMQQALARSQVPQNDVMHGLMIFMGGVLFAIPGFVSDAIALFLILPGTRHLAVAYVKITMARKFRQGTFRVFNAGFGKGFGTAFGTDSTANRRAPPPPTEGWQRDVTPKVIDVAPLSSEHVETPIGPKRSD